MTAFFFGNERKRLYGYYHEPQGQEQDFAVLFCHPWGQEYIRTHWALRQLAQLLARQGVAGLRFDYFATGDSTGESHEARLQEWEEDILLAVTELKIQSGLENICLVGPRMGGTLAALQASKLQDIRKIVLWDPVIEGKTYLQELQVLQKNLMERGLLGRPFPPASGQGQEEDLDEDFIGFTFPQALRESLQDLTLYRFSPASRPSLMIVLSQETPEILKWKKAQEEKGLSLQYALVPEGGDWNDFDELQHKLLPSGLLQTMVQFLVSGGRP